ncbi:uncharacterized protein LOC110036872 isoform X2 [Phalaenopsis equestris]|uniref:uncharacterized protein LOC110036872 isoform X2 n=1 Tax=Phalaenopsis equestris TaxID=78828 RepID=UPI0009E46186|nr:uncharacterized protein LOC110036872 isoform X2 [Phalaenopsis equestris]
MKKKIRVSEGLSSASTSYFFIGEEARLRFKYHCLLQDYQELFKETKEKGERLKMIMQKKLQLLAEVKFLRQKCHQFSAAQTVQSKLRNQSHTFPPASVCITEPKNPLFQTKLPSKSRNREMKEVPIPTSTPLLDLNQTGEEMERFEVKEKLLNVEIFKKLSRQREDVLANDSVFSVLRDRRMGWAGKRRVSWQDQQTLRV